MWATLHGLISLFIVPTISHFEIRSSGKTAAFVIPMLERLKTHSAKIGVRGIIISPTRELALQTLKFCKELGKHTDLRYCLIVGGDTMDSQFADIHANPDVIIATPGRLLHVVVEMELEMQTVCTRTWQ